MGLPRKGSSRINVNGVDYRWAVSPDSGYMVVVVQQDSGKGSRLEYTIENYELTITPAAVRAIILKALQDGWDPTSKAKVVRKKRT
ncbi:MAG TPA: hypothetical protein VNM14_06030 [Planctomycetota bacterium]|nr:hypothetical protein [Planctomycetota bacterium]